MERPKVLLINPDFNYSVTDSTMSFIGVPMSVVSVATFLKYNNIDVKIIDARLYKRNILERIENTIEGAGLVGFSVMTAQIKDALRLSGYIKQKYKGKKIVWGGVHPTLFPRQVLSNPLVDFAVIGEGEKTCLELITAIEGSHGSADFSQIKGIGFKNNGEIIINPRRELMDMDEIPFQSFELLDVDRYTRTYYPFIGLKRELQVQTSRGCPHRCAFCINYVERTYNNWRTKSPKLVLDEVRELIRRYKINAICFRDENMFVDKKHVEELTDGLAGLGIHWFANIRADYFNENHISENLLHKIKKSNIGYLGIGAESGVNRILQMICKDITVEQIIFSAEQLGKYNIAASYSFLIGLPGETRNEMLKTVELMKEIKKISPRSIFVGPQILRPYPGGGLYDLCVKNKYNSPDSLREWAVQGPGIFGEISLKNYPWIKQPPFVMAISTYVPAALNYDFMKKLGLMRRVYSLLARLRLKFNFWLFPYEYRITVKILGYKSIFGRFIYGNIFKKIKLKCVVSTEY